MADALVAEMQRIVRGAAEPWQPGDSVKAAIRRASRLLGLGERRVRTLWYGQPCAVRAVEADMLRARVRELHERRLRQLDAEIDLLRRQLAGEP